MWGRACSAWAGCPRGSSPERRLAWRDARRRGPRTGRDGVGRVLVLDHHERGGLRPAVPDVADEDLDRGGDRDRHERPEDAGGVRADEHRDDDEERRDVHGAAVDDGLDQVVLDLLVDQHHDRPDDRRRREVLEERHEADPDAADGRADDGNHVDEAHEHRERHGERDAEDRQDDVRHGPGDERDDEVAGHVAGDGPVHVPGHDPDLLLSLAAEEAGQPPPQRAPVEQQEERQREDGDELDDRREHADGDGLERRRGVPEARGQLARALLELVADVVALVVLPDGRVLLGLADVRRHMLRERVHLLDDGRDDERPDPDDEEEDQDVGEEDREPPRDPPAVEPVDRGAEGDRQEDGDEDEADDLADEVQDVETDGKRREREERARQGAGARSSLSRHVRRCTRLAAEEADEAADAPTDEETGDGRPHDGLLLVATQLPAPIRRHGDVGPQALDGPAELAAILLDGGADLLRRALGHQRVSAWDWEEDTVSRMRFASSIASSGTGGAPFWKSLVARKPAMPPTTNRMIAITRYPSATSPATPPKRSARPQAPECSRNRRPTTAKMPAAAPMTAPRTSDLTLVSTSAFASSISSRKSIERRWLTCWTASPIFGSWPFCCGSGAKAPEEDREDEAAGERPDDGELRLLLDERLTAGRRTAGAGGVRAAEGRGGPGDGRRDARGLVVGVGRRRRRLGQG